MTTDTETKVDLTHFIGKAQLNIMRSLCRGEEGEFFKGKIKEMETIIGNMAKTYETDGQGNAAIATLHYFRGGSDWWIIERDIEDDQLQAFGFACLNGDAQNAEPGYISIEELISYGVEIDLYFTPKTIGEIKAIYNP